MQKATDALVVARAYFESCRPSLASAPGSAVASTSARIGAESFPAPGNLVTRKCTSSHVLLVTRASVCRIFRRVDAELAVKATAALLRSPSSRGSRGRSRLDTDQSAGQEHVYLSVQGLLLRSCHAR